MDTAVTRVLERLEQRIAQEEAEGRRLSAEAWEARRNEWMLAVGPETGALLNMLVRLGKCRHILEVGTSVGYSTVWLAEGARTTGGRVTTLDGTASKHAQARDNLAQAGLAAQVELVLGDALESAGRLDGPWDFVLLDFNRGQYRACLERLLPKLAPGAVVVADNMLRPEATVPQAQAYQAWVRALPGVRSALLSAGNGLELSLWPAAGG